MASGFDFRSALGLGASGASAQVRSNAAAVDGAGHIYITGSFRGTVDFDPSASALTLGSGDGQDAFVAKYTPAGALVWARSLPGRPGPGPGGVTVNATGQGSALAVDGAGGVFVAGSFSGTVAAGPGPAELSSPDGTAAFAARLDPAGAVVWAVASGGGALGDSGAAHGLALDGSGGAVLAGSFSGTATFGPTTLAAGGASEAFAARLDGTGRFLWAVATRGAGGSNARAGGVAVDPSGGIALAGSFSGTVDFDPGPGPANLASAGSTDAAVWKLGSAGQLLWARWFGSADFDAAEAVAVDGSGNLLLTGAFSGSVDFGEAGRPDVLTSGPIFNAFVAKLGPAGVATWARGYLGPGGWSKGQAIGLDASGRVHVAGTFAGTVDFEPGAGLDNRASGGSTDAFVAGLDPAGGGVYALQAGLQNANSALGLAVDASGAVAITGGYTGPIGFGATTLPAIGSGTAGIFVARAAALPPAPASPTLQAASDTGPVATDGITSATSPTFDVASAGAGFAVQLLRGGVVVASRTGPGAVRDPGPLAEGIYAYAARLVDPAGLVGPAGPATSVTVLTRPPAAPTSAPILLDDSGLAGDGITNVRQPRLGGSTASGPTVRVVDASGIVYGQETRAQDGSYAIRLAAPLADGTYDLGVRVVDLAGNVGGLGPTLRLTIRTVPPATPAAPALLASDATGGPGLTNLRQPRLTGTAGAGVSVRLIGPTGNLVGSGAAGPDGIYVVRVASTLADGAYSIRAVATEAAGNASPPGPALSFAVDATPPAAPSAPTLLALDDTGAAGDGITSVARPRLAGSATPGITVRILGPSGNLVGSATASSSGSFVVLPSASLGDGSHSLRSVAVDPAGNVGPASAPFTLVVLTIPPPKPSPPALLAADDTGVVGDGMTQVRAPRLAGSAAGNARVEWLDPSGAVLASAVASAGGSYQLARPVGLANGAHSIRVRAVDAAGNVGAASDPFTLVIRVVAGDTFGVGRTDFAAYSPAANTFYIGRHSGSPEYVKAFGFPGDVPVSGDFFGLGHADVALYRPSTSTFYSFDAVTGAYAEVQLGRAGDVPAPADYDGDGKTDFAVYRPANSTFYVRNSATNAVLAKVFGLPGDIPAPADYFGTGHAAMAVYRPSNSTFVAYDLVTLAFLRETWGTPGDVPVPADYQGLGRANLATYTPGTSTFTIKIAGWDVPYVRRFGIPGDLPIPGDYFGDGQADIGVFRPGSSTFLVGEVTGPRFLVVPYGPVGVLRPVLGPLTNWYTFGAGSATPIGPPGGGGRVARSAFAPPMATVVEVAPPAFAPGARPRPATPAIGAEGLEGWRPGG